MQLRDNLEMSRLRKEVEKDHFLDLVEALDALEIPRQRRRVTGNIGDPLRLLGGQDAAQ